MLPTDKFYIDGAWVSPSSTDTIDVINPASGETIGQVSEGTAKDADLAVSAARKAFAGWSQTSPKERADYLRRICDGLDARRQELVDTLIAEVGMPRPMAEIVQVGLPITEAREQLDQLEAFQFEERLNNSIITHEAVGVVVGITPWNFPLLQAMRKVAPAIAAGCTVVLKPSEETPLSSYILAEVIDSVGLPAGVFNLVTGRGLGIGEALVTHPEVDSISFTGSTGAGRRISELASSDIKRVSLELGGKSAHVVLDDADMNAAAESTLASIFLNTGQACNALSRMLVPRNRLEEAEEAIITAATKHNVGDPNGEGVTMGPLVSAKQKERVLSYIQRGVTDGARVVLGGPEAQPASGAGYYVTPTVFSDVTPGMAIEQEEIFGPVLSIIAYDTEDEAVDIANGTIYGLAAGVTSADPEHARKVATRLRAGQIEINGGPFNHRAPFGGFKQSGRGRENGRFGFEEFLEPKSLQF